MRNKKFIQIVCALLIVSELFLPVAALAQVADVPTSNTALGTGGVAGTFANTLATGILKGANTANKICKTAEDKYFSADKAVSFGLGGLSLISGGASLKGQLQAKITAIQDGFITCRQAVLDTLKGMVVPNTYIAGQRQSLYDEIDAAINNLKAKLEPLKHQLQIADQGFWKTLVWNILIKTTKTVAINMVNKLIKQYHINDFAKYADAVATQVYDSEFILDNFSGTKADQMLVRSFLSNPLAQQKIQPQIFQRADVMLGFDPVSIPVSDPNFYQKMFYTGSGMTNPFMMQATFSNAAEMIHAKSLVTAQAEIAQSSGLKTPRDCRGTIAQQQTLDQSYDRVNKQLENRKQLFNDLTNAQKLGYPVNPDDLKKAQNDLSAAQKQWDVLPNSVNSPIVTICQAIVSPPSMISKGIDEGFKALGQNMGVYNDNNLPFFISFITDVANSVSNKLIFGGEVSASSLVHENIGNITKATNIAMSGIGSYSVSLSSKNLSATSTLSSLADDKKSAIFSIDWDASNVKNAQTISITGPGVPTAISGTFMNDLSGALPVTVNVPGSYVYTITVYGNSSADILATVKLTIDSAKAAASASSGTVSGAFISRAPLSLRGPEAPIHIRGD